jgi:hypothetical protein
MASPGKKSFLLRIDPALWAEVERLAAQELRSANAQVEYLLREGLARRGRRPAGGAAPAPQPAAAAAAVQATAEDHGPPADPPR